MREPFETTDIVLQVSDRPDGGLRVLSDGLEGLFLGGTDRQRIWSVVGPVVERLMQQNHGVTVLRVLGPMTAPAAGEVVLHVEHLPSTRLDSAA